MKERPSSHFARKFGIVFMMGCLAALPALGNGFGQSSATRQFQKTLTLGANQTVSLTHKYGDVRIHGENGRDVKISATIRVQAHSQAEAEKYADQVRIEVNQDSQGIRIDTVYPSDDSKFFVVRVGGPSYSVDYDITVPTDAKLWMKNSFGNVEVQGVQGWADLENSHGQLKFRDGGAAKISNSFGEVQVAGADGDVTVNDNNAAVTASSVKGALAIKDRFATITASNVTGAVSISGGNGSVQVTDAGRSDISNSFGSVAARNVHGDLIVNNNNGTIDADTVSGGAQLNGSFGSISVANVSGNVRCTSSNGKVSGRRIGSDVYVKTTFGEVSLEQVGGAVEVEDSNGGISVREIKGKANFNTSFGAIEASGLPKGVRATTGNGKIALSDVGGDVYAKTSFGSVDIRRVNGNLIIENSNGPVEASGVKGDASARTSFGAVTLEEIMGSITVDNQNGAVSVSGARGSGGCKNVSLKTSFAPIQVRLPGDAGYELTARTSFGHISSALPVTSTGTIGGDSLNGKIGSGGCSLSLTNSNGNIEILKL
jgi:DUF4097 and DUF4098 domain-containing protein YvlB